MIQTKEQSNLSDFDYSKMSPELKAIRKWGLEFNMKARTAFEHKNNIPTAERIVKEICRKGDK